MNKTLRIFRKDVQHLWPEITLCLLLTLGFALTQHTAWDQNDHSLLAAQLCVWTNVLMPLSWWMLIGRAIHDEPLTGDRQFWVTRPYGTYRVLLAKVILLGTFICLPLFGAQVYLLHHAHLAVGAAVPGLLWRLALLLLFVFAPLFALSAVTPTINRMVLVLLGTVVYTGFVIYFASLFGVKPEWKPGREYPLWEGFALVIVPAASVVVVALQYARRCTRLSWSLLAGMVLTITMAGLLATYIPHNFYPYVEPAAGEPALPSVTLDQALTPPAPTPLPAARQDELFIPVRFAAILPGHALLPSASTATLRFSDGYRLTVPWNRNSREPIETEGRYVEAFSLYPHYSRQALPAAVTIDLTFAVDEFEADAGKEVVTSAEYRVPYNGVCRESGPCRYALLPPRLTHVTCTPRLGSGTERWIGEPEPSSLDVRFDPVHLVYPRFAHSGAGTCDSPETFKAFHLLRHRLLHVTLGPFDPKSYVQSTSGVEFFDNRRAIM